MSVQPRPWLQPAPGIVAAVAVMYRGKRERRLPVMVCDQLGEWLSERHRCRCQWALKPPAVRDLLLAEQELRQYELGELADIESIMRGERRERTLRNLGRGRPRRKPT